MRGKKEKQDKPDYFEENGKIHYKNELSLYIIATISVILIIVVAVIGIVWGVKSRGNNAIVVPQQTIEVLYD